MLKKQLSVQSLRPKFSLRHTDFVFVLFTIFLTGYLIYQIESIKVPIWDSAVYLVNARNWAENMPLIEGFRPPLISWVIMAFNAVLGGGFEAIKYVSIIFPIVTSVLLYSILRRSSGGLFALTVVILTMLNQQVLTNNTQVLSEGISLLFLVLQLYLFRSNNPRNWIFGGVALGLTFAARYPIGVQAIAILLAEVIFNNNIKLFRNALMGAAPIILIAIALVILKTGAFQMTIE